jgi:hypothetical protein
MCNNNHCLFWDPYKTPSALCEQNVVHVSSKPDGTSKNQLGFRVWVSNLFFGKGSQGLLWASFQVTCVKITIRGVPNHLDYYVHFTIHTYYVQAVPLQACSGPEGSSKLRFPDYMTTAQGGGKVVSLTHRPPLPPGNAPGTHFC